MGQLTQLKLHVVELGLDTEVLVHQYYELPSGLSRITEEMKVITYRQLFHERTYLLIKDENTIRQFNHA